MLRLLTAMAEEVERRFARFPGQRSLLPAGPVVLLGQLQLISSSRPRERWSRLLDPTFAHPSTMATLACSIVGWYSKTRTPDASSGP